MDAKQRLPVEFYKTCFSLHINETERIYAKALHHPKTPWDGSVRHQPHNHVGSLRSVDHKIPKSIMGRGCLRYLIMRLRFYCVDDIRKLNGVLNKKDRNVISDEIVVAVFCIKLSGETAHVAYCIG